MGRLRDAWLLEASNPAVDSDDLRSADRTPKPRALALGGFREIAEH
jgi:hypothetical protein